MIITIDGPAGAGKGTVARFLAEKYNLKKLDTGLLYRALAKEVIASNLDPQTHATEIVALARQISIESTNQEDLRTEIVANMASKIASSPEVRKILNQLQRDFAHGDPSPFKGVILDGRDIGTVICPEADCKIFLTASSEVRAMRRNKEGGGTPHSHGEISKIMVERDTRDQNRKVAPLSAAENAHIIDTTHLTIDEVCSRAAYYVDQLYLKKKNINS
ncbi:(d)CMP kinase [Candidatus Paracaedibacter symbiosus]|uniref:(d)CMP kinase n=1 Tax=Candidatus Paracaedibacter symbiosus TaxID=244582 RepID=UPI000509FD26|nr:(d)CMP kinase [Candidatus Paracaedibacter symbiosus]